MPKTGQLIQTTRDLTYDPLFYLYPVDRGVIFLPAGTRLTTLKRPPRTKRTSQVYTWIKFEKYKLLVPEDAFEIVPETVDEAQQRLCITIENQALQELKEARRRLISAEKNFKEQTLLAKNLAQLRPGDYALIRFSNHDEVVRIDKFERNITFVTTLASEMYAPERQSFFPSDIYKVTPYPVIDLPLLIGWKYKYKALDKALKERKS